jgi:hypothetical protein
VSLLQSIIFSGERQESLVFGTASARFPKIECTPLFGISFRVLVEFPISIEKKRAVRDPNMSVFRSDGCSARLHVFHQVCIGQSSLVTVLSIPYNNVYFLPPVTLYPEGNIDRNEGAYCDSETGKSPFRFDLHIDAERRR